MVKDLVEFSSRGSLKIIHLALPEVGCLVINIREWLRIQISPLSFLPFRPHPLLAPFFVGVLNTLDKHLTTEPHTQTLVHWRRGLSVASTPKHQEDRCVTALAEISNPQVPWAELLVMTVVFIYCGACCLKFCLECLILCFWGPLCVVSLRFRLALAPG